MKPHSPLSQPVNHRLWLPSLMALLGLGTVCYFRFQPELETNLKSWLTLVITVLAALLILLWFFFLGRFSARIRLKALLGLIIAVVTLSQIFRVDGVVDGTGIPQFVSRWSARSHSSSISSASSFEGTESSRQKAEVSPLGARDVPQFFGPARDGIVRDAHLSRDWNTEPPRELWRKPVGAGWSAFAVAGPRAFTQEQIGEEECVSALDLLTGALIWRQKNTAQFSQWQGGDGPRATPTFFEGQIFTYGATGFLQCLDAKTGKLVWSREVLMENQLTNLIWGTSSSPLVFRDTVIVSGGMSAGPTLFAYRRADGELLWKSGTDKASYSSPILAKLLGNEVVLSFNASVLTGHSPTSGKVLLEIPWADDKWPKASQPVVLNEHQIFISAGYGAGGGLFEIQAGADGALVATQVWKTVRMKTQFNSVAASNGYLYGLDDGGLACVDLKDGSRKWKEGRFGSGQTLLVDDLCLIQSEAGAVVLADASPEGYHELGRIPALAARTWNHPTLAGRYLLVRNSEEMVCYELPVSRAVP